MKITLELNDRQVMHIEGESNQELVTITLMDDKADDKDVRMFTMTRRKAADIHTFLGVIGATRENTEKNKKKTEVGAGVKQR